MWAIEQTTRATRASWKHWAVLGLVLSVASTVWPNTAAEPVAGPTPRPHRAGHDLATGEEALQQEVHRLRRNLVAIADRHQSTRNPFDGVPSSGGAHERRAAAVPPPVRAPAPRDATAALPFTLIGIAENQTGAEPERFAILAWNDQPVIAAEGERVGGRYVVRRIEAGAIEVIDGDAAPAIRLTLGDK